MRVAFPQKDHEEKGFQVAKTKFKWTFGEGKRVPVSEISDDTTTQSRTVVRTDVVDEYRESMKRGDVFPDVIIISDGTTGWIVDGWHRVAAARELGGDGHVSATVNRGTLRDAQWHAARSNRTHGMRRSNSDKVRAVMLALGVEPELSLREIAEWCGVSHEMVRQYKTAKDVPQDAGIAVEDAADVVQVREDEQTPASDSMDASRRSIAKIIKAIDALSASIDSLVSSKDGTWVNAQSVQSDCANIRSAIAQAAPHCECPLCGGLGCTGCREVGWVSKKQFQLMPRVRSL